MPGEEKARTLRRGRPAKEPRSKLGKFLYRHLRAHRLTQAELARRLGVSSATVWRLLHGASTRLDSVTSHQFCHALELDDLNRRQFLVLAASAGISFALAKAPTAMPLESSPAMLIRYRRIDLDAYQLALDGWKAAVSHACDPVEALGAVQQLDGQLHEMRSNALELRITDLRIQSAGLLSALQEAILPWRASRPWKTIATYDAINAAMLTAPPGEFQREYVRMKARRAVLLREGNQARWCAAELEEMDDRTLRATHDPVAEIAIACQRMHTMAIQNEMDRWRREADRIRQRVESLAAMDAELHAELNAIVDYTMGVGFKGFMWNLARTTPASPRVQRYADEACTWFEKLRTDKLGGLSVRDINLYHSSITAELSEPEFESAEIDALVWCDPAEAIRRSESLRAQAEARYPAVVRKLDADIALARRRLGIR